MQQVPIILFGEVLFDRFPDGEQVLGGAPFNVAWHLQAFQQQPLLISRIGVDSSGQLIQSAMQNWGLNTAGLQLDAEFPTGTVAVSLNQGEPDYQILPKQAYDFIVSSSFSELSTQILYHGSLAIREPLSRQSLQCLKQHLQAKVFLDVNLREPWWTQELVQNQLAAANWVKLNHQELKQLQVGGNQLLEQMQLFLDHYQLDGLIVTLAEQGAIALNRQGEQVQIQPQPLQQTLVDTVGAGDAFAALILLGLLNGWSLTLSMQRAQQFASALLTVQGATVNHPAFYQAFIQAWLA